jgi:large subunit ribosomal protein L17e
MSNPSHIEVILAEADEVVEKSLSKDGVKLNSRQRGREARRALTQGEN